MIKFNVYNVQNTETKKKVKVWYSVSERVDGRKAVCIYSKSYMSGSLKEIGFSNVQNDTDTMTDYFDEDRVYIFENDNLYTKALEAAQKYDEKAKVRYEKARIKNASKYCFA